MNLSEYERALLGEIEEWENAQFDVVPNDFIRAYDEWMTQSFSLIPEDIQEKFFKNLDQWIYYIHAAIQQSKPFEARIKRIIQSSQLYNENITYIQDLKQLPLPQLNYLADQEVSAHRLYALTQGGLSSSGNPLLFGLDFPILAVINLRLVQLIANCYGYDTRNPYEMAISLKVFHAATLPKRFQGSAWTRLISEIEGTEVAFFYEGDERMSDIRWLNQPLIHLLKNMVILLFQKRKNKKVPLTSIVIGATVNYQLTKNVSEFAKRFYQYRYLLEKK